MNTDEFFVLFDLAIAVLGVFLVFIGIKCKKSGTLHTLLVPIEEQMKCKDVAGLSNYLMPKTAIFGVSCIAFGILGFLDDYKIIALKRVGNTILLVAFLICLCVYVFFLKRSKKLFIQ